MLTFVKLNIFNYYRITFFSFVCETRHVFAFHSLQQSSAEDPINCPFNHQYILFWCHNLNFYSNTCSELFKYNKVT